METRGYREPRRGSQRDGQHGRFEEDNQRRRGGEYETQGDWGRGRSESFEEDESEERSYDMRGFEQGRGFRGEESWSGGGRNRGFEGSRWSRGGNGGDRAWRRDMESEMYRTEGQGLRGGSQSFQGSRGPRGGWQGGYQGGWESNYDPAYQTAGYQGGSMGGGYQGGGYQGGGYQGGSMGSGYQGGGYQGGGYQGGSMGSGYQGGSMGGGYQRGSVGSGFQGGPMSAGSQGSMGGYQGGGYQGSMPGPMAGGASGMYGSWQGSPGASHGPSGWRGQGSGMQQGWGGQSWTEGPSRRFSGKGPRNYKRSDDRIREDVSDCLTDDDQIDASNLEVSVQNGEVTLKGFVEDRQMKRRAEDVVECVSGVKEVSNQIRVQAPQQGVSSSSSYESGTGNQKESKSKA